VRVTFSSLFKQLFLFTFSISHTYWGALGTNYTLKATAKEYPDPDGSSSVSYWSILLPRNKEINTQFHWLSNFLQSHPNLFPIIRQILNQ